MTATEILDAILTNWVSVEQMSRIEADQDIANTEVVKGERVPGKSYLLVFGEKLYGRNGELEPDMIIRQHHWDEDDIYFLYAID